MKLIISVNPLTRSYDSVVPIEEKYGIKPPVIGSIDTEIKNRTKFIIEKNIADVKTILEISFNDIFFFKK